ncbi:hypothetical protein [Lactobacillus crispatus]|jgi:hypothetical protein|uniref:hypothetical protein n=1 Tax=Lactobacillus crispatus TaxID=47770 RepID=UPI0001BAE4F6|nr:hypothetical protein [Lactobacillus crispatus]EEX29382.1 hypothetical protein HMPREF0508_01144 [Lactobacillus crispatus MV-3A-US]KWU12289.1 hypothetical protein AEL97_03790 [Lactobacillus crispatus]MBI1710984.1 hypothetical protein [Lactobacillus crispatus]MBI1719408.1 hypothetical protein [Lactobacillus crispatus]MCT7767755.1 hypothetical protein [Lactobacillus crispatus]
MLDHMIFNKLKWWDSTNRPLIGKRITASLDTYHTVKAGFNFTAADYSNVPAKTKVENALIVAAYKFNGSAGNAPSGTYILTDQDNSKWLKLDGSEKLGGGN